MGGKMLNINHLSIQFKNGKKWVTAVSDISYSVEKGETVGLVGESGCGKSVSSMAIMGLLPEKRLCRVDGNIEFEGKDLLTCTSKEIRNLRGNRISMIFQEPMTCFNPVIPIGKQIEEAILVHRKVERDELHKTIIDLFEMVGIADPKNASKRYPFELSGGMRQRAMIAMAMSSNPDLLIADEPTTALDVTIQAQILDLIRNMQKKTNTATLMITHDLGVIADICERVIVMYAGKIVEKARTIDLFDSPYHPYTSALLRSIPRATKDAGELYSIPGTVPAPGSILTGCMFAPRCERATEKCRHVCPEMEDLGNGHYCACWNK